MQEQQTPVVPNMPISEAPKNNNKTLVIVLIILIVAIIVAAIAAVVIIVNVNKEVQGNPVSKTEDETTQEIKETEEETETKPAGGTEETEEKEEVEETLDAKRLVISRRDTAREDDLARFLTAINNYQTNNNGKTPFSDGAVDKNFIKRYIDPDAVTDDGMNVTKCGNEFKDPNDKCYNFTKPEVLKANKKNALNGVKAVNNKVYVFINARCGDGDGELIQGTGLSQIAIMYKLEKDDKTIACYDNY